MFAVTDGRDVLLLPKGVEEPEYRRRLEALAQSIVALRLVLNNVDGRAEAALKVLEGIAVSLKIK
jgi:hypothetical protein